MNETFSEFKNSFSYGSRSDLNFKFLKSLSDEEAAKFFQELLWKFGDSFDDGDYTAVMEHVIAGQMLAYDKEGPFKYEDGPFCQPDKPLSESRVMLLTSSGNFVKGDDPQPFGVKNMTQDEAMRRIGEFLKIEPTLSEIPINTPDEKVKVRHGGYDIRGAALDTNVTFPLVRMWELAEKGMIGELVNPAFSFVGACAQMPLLKKTAPKWIARFREMGVDTAVLVPV